MSGRIRTVKPEWLDDEKLGAASDAARMLSIGLMLLADDHGRGRAHPLFIASRVWAYGDPHESLTKVSDGLAELESLGFVRLYEVSKQQYFEIRNWLKHQKVQHPSAPRIPAPPPDDEPPTGTDPQTAGQSAAHPKNQGQKADPQPQSNGASHKATSLRLMTSSGDPHETLTPDPDPDPDLDPDQDQDREVAPAPVAAPAAPSRPAPEDLTPRIAELESKYPAAAVADARSACARYRKTGKMADSVWLATLEQLEAFAPEFVVSAMRIFADRYSDGSKNENYLVGITRGEAERGRRTSGWRPPTTRDEYAASSGAADLFGNPIDTRSGVTAEDLARLERLGNRRAHG
jgi:hypothetical protein